MKPPVIEALKLKTIHFPKGLLGFETYTQYKFVSEDDIPFFHLQGVEEHAPSFILTDPFLFYKDYEFDLQDAWIEELQVSSVEQLAVFSIVSIQKELQSATLNLLAPIVINFSCMQAKQLILQHTSYTTKHPLKR